MMKHNKLLDKTV
jgi:WD40 repeat protein